MRMTKGLLRPGLAVGLFALLLGLSAAFASTTHAQNPPAKYYGPAAATDVVEAWIDGVSCGTADVESGTWIITIPEDAPCGPLGGGETVSFTLNGDATNETVDWAALGNPGDGGYPANPGITLTLAETPAAPMPTETPAAPMPVETPAAPMPVETPAAPMPAETGNAGLLAEQGASPLLALALGALALAMLGGARAVTGRVR